MLPSRHNAVYPFTQRSSEKFARRRARHLARKDISRNALRVLERLHANAGFEAYIVGGAVRDLLVGLRPTDFDVATNATPEEVRGLFRSARLIGRRFRLAHVRFGREIIEVATFRGLTDDGEDGDRERSRPVEPRAARQRLRQIEDEDALRRDFTANALYVRPERGFSVRDYTGGYRRRPAPICCA